MKNIFFAGIVFCFLQGTAQSFTFEHPGNRIASVSKQKLKEAKLLGDIISDGRFSHAVNIFAEVSSVQNGKTLVEKSTGAELTSEQKAILNLVETGTNIHIQVRFEYKNDPKKVGELDYYCTPGPELEASYPGGNEKMSSYLKENITNKLDTSNGKSPAVGTIAFVVNEDGSIANAEIYRKSPDPKTDKLLIQAITNMPKWNAAENTKGQKIKQKFILTVSPPVVAGKSGC